MWLNVYHERKQFNMLQHSEYLNSTLELWFFRLEASAQCNNILNTSYIKRSLGGICRSETLLPQFGFINEERIYDWKISQLEQINTFRLSNTMKIKQINSFFYTVWQFMTYCIPKPLRHLSAGLRMIALKCIIVLLLMYRSKILIVFE